ncbi:hypothetical protein D3C80_786040 [compost metagenome]
MQGDNAAPGTSVNIAVQHRMGDIKGDQRRVVGDDVAVDLGVIDCRSGAVRPGKHCVACDLRLIQRELRGGTIFQANRVTIGLVGFCYR